LKIEELMTATTLNLAYLLDHQARLTPTRDAVVHGAMRLTYAQINAMANQVAGGLRSLGLQPGDHIALSCPNLPYFPIAYYGILKMGGVVVPLNVLLKPREIAYHLKDSQAKALLVFEGTAELPMAQMAREACDEVEHCAHLVVMTVNPAGPSPVERAMTFGQLIHTHPPVGVTHPSAPGDTAVILYTSGTTGQPKGAELTHFNMAANAMASRDMYSPLLNAGPTATNKYLITLPLFHSTGQTAQMNAGISSGGTLILLPRFDAATTLKTMLDERINFWVAVPTMYWALLQHARQTGVDVSPIAAELKICVSGGAPMPIAVMEDFQKTFGVRVLEGYGLSETSPVACFNQVHLPSKAGTVGLPIFGVEVRVVDDHDVPMPTGERGEIVIRGHNVMKGYFNRPDETAAALRGGWFHTGDIGIIDADGYVSIVDRKKDMVLRGGMNVYPREIEEILMTHPAVSLAAVVGVPDDRLGEEIKAFVVLKPGATLTAEELIAWSKDQLAAYKYPRTVEIRESLPVGPTGKVFKRALK
jgi:long-chain acyl-CoA synthetase